MAAALLGCILFATGCIRSGALDTDREAIRFTAGSLLLRNDAPTKSTTEAFNTNGESFVIFGEKVTSSGVHTPVFDGVSISHHINGGNYWDYEIHRFWNWTSQSDRYDFVAVYPSGMGTVNENSASNLSVSTPYSYNSNDQDILVATYRRNGTDWNNRYNRVDLSFSHMGSAVGVIVLNNSSSAPVTVTSIHFENLVVSADAKVSLDNYGQKVMRWTNLTPSAASVREQLSSEQLSSGGITIAAQSSNSVVHQIMIPQNLHTYTAKLVLSYSVNSVPQGETKIDLETITRSDGTPITSWDAGYKYTYSISMRLDGGLLVTVTTTPWDEPVEAETPGILI